MGPVKSNIFAKFLEYQYINETNIYSILPPPPLSMALRPNAAQNLLILEVSRPHTTTHHSR